MVLVPNFEVYMKVLNVVAPWLEQTAWSMMTHCISCGFEYEQFNENMRSIGYHVPEDLFITLNAMFDITVDLEIGQRKGEVV